MRRWTRAMPILALAATALAVAPPADAGAAPALSFCATSPVDYGSVTVGVSVARTTFTVTNRGGASTASLKVTLTGTAFTIPAGGNRCTAVALEPEKSCTVTVTYTPAAAGANETATLTVSSKKPAASASLNLTRSSPASVSQGCSTINGSGSTAYWVGGYTYKVGEVITLERVPASAGMYAGPVSNRFDAIPFHWDTSYTIPADGMYSFGVVEIITEFSPDGTSWSWSCTPAA